MAEPASPATASTQSAGSDTSLYRAGRLNEIARVLSSRLDLEVVLPDIVRLAAEIGGADAAAIGLVEPDGVTLVHPYLFNLPPALGPTPLPQNKGLAWQVIQTGKSILLPEYSWHPQALPRWVEAGVHASLIVPIAAGQVRAGTLALFMLKPARHFSERELHLVESIGRQAGAAIQTARLFENLRRRSLELESLATVSAALRKAPGRAEMLPIVLDQVLAVLGAHSAVLALRDPASGQAVIEQGRGAWASAVGRRLPVGQGIADRAIADARPYQVVDAQASPEMMDRSAIGSPGALVAVPLITQGETIGVLLAARSGESGRSRPFDSSEMQQLTSIGDLAASAIQRATLHEQTRQRLQRLTALRRIDITIMSSLDLNVTLDVLLDHVINDLAVDAATVLLHDPAAGTLDYAAARGFRTVALQHTHLRLGEGNAGRAAKLRRVVHIPNLPSGTGDLSRAPLLGQENFVAYYAHPLIAKGEVRGVLEIFHRARLDPDAEWREFLEALAAQAAIALDNAVLFNDLQRSLEAQRATQAQLVRAARLTAVGELAAGVAHQINNPLTTVIADAQLLLRSIAPDHPGYSSANAIYQAGWRAQRVVQRLLNFSRPEEGLFVPTELNESIVAALDLVSAHIERGGIELQVELAPDLPAVPGSERQLEEVWINLLLNARDALIDGRAGVISISSRQAADGQGVEVAVTDNGRGMDEDAQAKVFTPFFTTKEQGRGNGLGLSVCQSIVQNHGGTISFDSEAGQGTTFLVRLPRMT